VQLRFADCAIDCDQYELLRAGQRIDVQPKVWSFLRMLAENAHRVVPKDEILSRLWPDVIVAEASLQRLASLARGALGDPELLRTIRGVGYQLAAEVHVAGEPRAAPAHDGAAADALPGAQEIRFCRTVDGANIAWASLGSGPALVRALGWFSNLEYEWAWLRARRFWEMLGEGRRLIRYDGRGMGLSDPWREFSPELRLRDLEAVVAAAGEQRIDLVGLSEGCGTAIRFAVRHPSRVRRLVLYGPPGFLFLDRTPELVDLGRVMRELIKAAWGAGRSNRFGQMLAELFVGASADEETRALFDRMQRASTDRETALAYFNAMPSDARDEARKLSVPTLIVHRREDGIAPFEAAKVAASNVPGARFVPLVGDNHWPMADDLSAPVMIRAIRDFLAD
jgi:pimeloyl-ACP methyl ester carboxylesterase/DNA-binding winged helix-turn-helix (wHTH) protein